MAKIKGVSFLIKVNTGTPELPVYTSVGGQKSATLSLTTDTIDATDKLSADWEENLPSFRHWSLSGNGNGDEGNTGIAALEASYFDGEQLMVQLETPAGKTYTGTATMTDLSYDAPHDDLFTFSTTLQGSGPLVKAPGA